MVCDLTHSNKISSGNVITMNDESIKLGLMPPLTGLVGIYGSEIAHAGQVACQEINENGGVLGRPLELIIEDDGSLPESAVVAARKLVDEHQCTAIIGNLLSNSRIAVAYRIAEPRKVPLLNFSFYEGSILSRYFFHFAALPNQQIDKMIPYMREKYGPRMFFAGNNYEWPRGSIHAAKRVLRHVGGEVVGEEYSPIGVEPEVIERLLDHVEEANPDVFVPYFAGLDQVLLLTRFTERGLKKRMAVVMGHYDEMMASQLTPEVREGFYSSNTYFMTVDTAENHQYLKRLANLPDVDGIWPKGNGILTNFGEGTYVCVKAFAEAANKAGSLDSEDLVEALRTIQVKAPQGIVSMNPEHQHGEVNTYLSQCNADGVFNIIENFGAIEPIIPERYKHQRIERQATLEDDIRLQARILEQMSEGVILTSSLDGSIVYTNAGAESLFGYNEGEMIGLPFATINGREVNDSHETAVEVISILNKTGEWQGEISNIKKDGTSIWCSSIITTFTHPLYGEVWLAVMRDITEKKLAAEELRQNKERFELAVRGTNDGIWDWDIVTGADYFSPHFRELLGYSEDDEFPQVVDSFLSRIHPDDKDRVADAIKGHIEKNEPYNIEMRLQKKDGSYVWFLSRGQAIWDIDGKPMRMAGSVTDITERKKHEEKIVELNRKLETKVSQRESELRDSLVLLEKENYERQQAQNEAERANQLKSEFLGRMSHELRTPMNAILGFGQLLEEEPLNANQKSSMNEIMNASRHLLDLIDEVLDLTKIETGNVEIHLKSTSITEVIQESIGIAVTMADAKKIKIANVVTDDQLIVMADRLRVKEVLLNLLSNAIKYNHESGSVSINSSINPDGNLLRINVMDSGKGLDEDKQQLVFEPFSRLGEEYSDIEGTGIGLTITKQLMELMGGSVGVESIVDQGSTFWIELPLAEVVETSSNKIELTDDVRINLKMSKTILYIEDNPANMRLVQKVFDRYPNWHLYTAPDAEQGIELARDTKPDLVIMDLNLPGMDGYEALARLRNYPETKDLKYIALSAAAMPRDIERGLLAGFRRYITKPIQLDELREVLQLELVDSHSKAI